MTIFLCTIQRNPILLLLQVYQNHKYTLERPKKRNRSYSPPKPTFIKKYFLEDVDTNNCRYRKIDFEALEADLVIKVTCNNVKSVNDIAKLNEVLNYRCKSNIKI